jgi:hypothetical protein
LYRSLIEAYIGFLLGGKINFPLIPTDIIDKLKYILQSLGFFIDDVTSRNGFIRWVWKKEAKLITISKCINMFLHFHI